MKRQPVLYLDLDDTLLAYSSDRSSVRAAPGARDFLLWALGHYEVRWLTTWCRTGRMEDGLGDDLCRMLHVPRTTIDPIRGLDWSSGCSKLDGIAWTEHIVQGRRFLWIEDEWGVSPEMLDVLAAHGLSDCYRQCNVSTEPTALRRVHTELMGHHGLSEPIPA